MEDILRAAFAPTVLDIQGDSGSCGAKVEITIVSPAFEGVPLIQRHRMVQSALAEVMKSVHALTLKTLTPAQWEAKQAAAGGVGGGSAPAAV